MEQNELINFDWAAKGLLRDKAKKADGEIILVEVQNTYEIGWICSA